VAELARGGPRSGNGCRADEATGSSTLKIPHSPRAV